jgi:hypothetical protein
MIRPVPWRELGWSMVVAALILAAWVGLGHHLSARTLLPRLGLATLGVLVFYQGVKILYAVGHAVVRAIRKA